MGQRVKNRPAIQEMWVRSLLRIYPLEEGMAIHSVFLPGESYGQRKLVSYSSWGHKESHTIEATEHRHTHPATGDTERVEESVSDLGRNFRWSQ